MCCYSKIINDSSVRFIPLIPQRFAKANNFFSCIKERHIFDSITMLWTMHETPFNFFYT